MTDGADRTEADDRAALPREARQSVLLTATLERFGSSETTRHRVRDLSPNGMRIEQASGLKVGATVLVAIGRLEAVGATIAWVREGSAGLSFSEAVNPDEARAKAVVAPKASVAPHQARELGATAGWVSYLNNPYRK